MAQKLTDTTISKLPKPKTGNRITYDDDGDKRVPGFGVRTTAAGARSFILNYRTRGGRERRITIGAVGDWKIKAAREEARTLRRRIDQGEDPLAALEANRDAKTVADLAARFLTEHSERKNRASTTAGYRSFLDRWVLPKLKHLKVAEVTFSDIDGLHARVTTEGGPYVANRVLAVLSKMFNLSIRWQWRTDNPARGVERNQEEKRQRYMSYEEIAALIKAMDEHEDQQACNIIRLLLLTGARRGEVLSARWEQFDLATGVWIKPGATTKQKTAHRVPLSAPARQLLSEISTEAQKAARSHSERSPWVFPGRVTDQHRESVRRCWAEVCNAAGLTGDKAVRIHDIRHSYASILASAGLSLPVIGQLLGHTQPATTARYAHLFDDPLRAATERVGAIVDAGKKPTAEVVDITRGRA
jgi:integrase